VNLRTPGLQGLLIGSLVLVGFLASLAVLLVVLSTLESSIQRDQADRQARELRDQVALAGRDSGLDVPLTSDEVEAYARSVRAEIGGEVRVVYRANSFTGPREVSVPGETPVLDLFPDRPFSAGAAFTPDREAIAAEAPLYATGLTDTSQVGSLRVAAPVRGLAPELGVVQQRVFIAVVLVLALASITGWGLSRLIGKRAARLARTASQLAGGNLAARAPSGGPQEMQMLADSLNVMAGRLEDLVSDITHERDRATAMIGSLAEGVVAVTVDGDVSVANRAARRFLGVAANAPMRLGDLPEPIAEAARAVLDPATPRTLAREVALPGGPELELAAARISARTGGGAVLTLRDVTDARRLERARRDLVANVSHELKTPLAAIKGFQELLEGDGLDAEHRSEFLGLMRGEIARLERLVEEQLQLARLDAGALPLERTAVDLADLAIGTAEPRRVLAERDGVTLTVELGQGGDVVVDADPARIEQILLILLDNALRHTPEGGRVRVIVGREGDMATIAVADSGEGIPPEDQEVVFDRFYRRDASRSRPGAGLGLAIARGLAEAHGGSIELSSTVGEGSTFTVRVPIAPPDDEPPAPAGSEDVTLQGVPAPASGMPEQA
jgi:two-component system sensor histidine kinase ResE